MSLPEDGTHVEAMTFADEDDDIPARRVEGILTTHPVSWPEYTQCWVDGVQVDAATVRPMKAQYAADPPHASDDETADHLAAFIAHLNDAIGDPGPGNRDEILKAIQNRGKQAPNPAQYAKEDWESHTIVTGERKGQSAFKNRKTGEIRDKIPEESEAGGEGPGQKNPSPYDAELKQPGVLAKVKRAVKAVKEKVTEWAYHATPYVMTVAGEIFDTPDDFRKFGFAPSMSGTHSASGDPFKAATGISFHLASSIAAKALAYAITKAKKHLGTEPATKSPSTESPQSPQQIPAEPTPTTEPPAEHGLTPEQGQSIWRKATASKGVMKPADVEQLGEYLPSVSKGSLQGLASLWKIKQTGNKGDLIGRLMEHANANSASVDLQHKDPNHPIARMIRANPKVKQVIETMQTHATNVRKAREEELRLRDENKAVAEKCRAMEPGPERDAYANSAWRDASEAYKAATAKANKLATGARDEFVAAMKPEAPGKVAGEFNAKIQTAKLDTHGDYAELNDEEIARAKSHYDPAVAFVESVCDYMGTLPVAFGVSKAGRAWAQKASHVGGTHNVALISNLSGSPRETETAVHELGHVIEFTKPRVAEYARSFVEYRCAGEAPTKLATVSPGANFADSEVGRRDQFHKVFGEGHAAYYVGKQYASGDTEVVSMGMEKLYSDPAGFAEKDPEYFAFMVHVLSS
jgi:hypothetical protein